MSKLKVVQITSNLYPDTLSFLGLSDKNILDYEYRSYLPDKSVFSVVLKDNVLSGTQAYMPYLLNINGETLLTGRSERTRLDKSLRGTGSFSLLMENCAKQGLLNGMAFSWGFTTAKKAFQSVGYHVFEGFLEHAFYSFDIRQSLISALKEKEKKLKYAKLFSAITCPFTKKFNSIKSKFNRKKDETYIVESELKHENDIKELFNLIKGSKKLVFMEQDEKFIKWAFKDGKRSYLRYYAYKEEKLMAYIVIDITTKEVAVISDFAVYKEDALLAAWEHACSDLIKNKTVFVRAAYNKKNEQICKGAGILRRIGFIPLHRGANMVVRPLSFNNLNVLGDISLWYITPLWSTLHGSRSFM